MPLELDLNQTWLTKVGGAVMQKFESNLQIGGFCLAYTECIANYAIDGFIYLCIYVFIYVFVHESQAAVTWLRG